jgi:hypothetical protein
MDEKIDKWLGKWASRKLLVWMTSTTMLAVARIDGDQWVAVSLAYIGLTGVADIATAWKHGR